MRRLGVGFLGAGIATQAIHLPTLTTLADRFVVRQVMDVDAEVAAEVAASAGARGTTEEGAVIANPDVDIVVVASPAQYHAAQVIAACEAGKKAVLCEKPLALSRADGQRILNASRSSGTPVLAGTMHAYDPACRAAAAAWRSLGADAVLVRSAIYLPADDRYIGAATQPLSPPPPWTVPAQPWPPGFAAAFLTDMMLGLTIHDIPFLRGLLPPLSAVPSAAVLEPVGYAITARYGASGAELVSIVTGAWDADWKLEAWAEAAQMSMSFPPSYVHAGSAVARLRADGETREWQYPHNGYRAEWDNLADVARGEDEPWLPLPEAVADLEFALALAEGAGAACQSAR